MVSIGEVAAVSFRYRDRVGDAAVTVRSDTRTSLHGAHRKVTRVTMAYSAPLAEARPRSDAAWRSTLRLFAEFQFLVDDTPLNLPHSCERVLAFVGMSPVPVSRTRLAGNLWPDVAEHRAKGDLRSALWRLRRITGVIHEDDHRLALAAGVDVDVGDMSGLARSLITEPERTALDRVTNLVDAFDILPGWDEEWLVVERERYRITRLRALERSAEAFLSAGDHARALAAALASVATEPYRETAHRLVIQVHLSEGNNAEAIRAYREYRSLISAELGLVPSELMEDLVARVRR
jgi:DNA-binding SARP family transcriptional activator